MNGLWSSVGIIIKPECMCYQFNTDIIYIHIGVNCPGKHVEKYDHVRQSTSHSVNHLNGKLLYIFPLMTAMVLIVNQTKCNPIFGVKKSC